ncbi:MAG: DUF2357 domain-containing protein [Paludibacteraceae bacterium]|nr:DUF2357 domain-containing protein [Paludibacteraceae bacterium]
MEVLRIVHSDFTLTFECEDWQKRWEKGSKLLEGAHHLTSTYTCSDLCEITHEDEFGHHKDILAQGAPNQNAFFFEQTDYSIWCEFKTPSKVTSANVETNRQDVNKRFSFKSHQQILMGFLNYENEIGRSDFPLTYTTADGVTKHFVFSYDVLSTKLDYHHDWKIILRDIEEEYRMLSLDYLRKTYHGISEGDGESFDLIWWNIFHGLQEQFIRATKNIIDQPRHRLRDVSSYKRADQIRRFTPVLEQQFAEHRTEEAHQYFVAEQQTTHNTIENRFLKHALTLIEKRYSALAKRILDEYVLNSESEKEHIRKTADELKHLVRNPFFRTIGKFEGLRQESLILQRDVNYSKIYRTYAILQKSFSLNDGMYRMETKDIATLYEIWCFIQVEKVVKQLFCETGKPDVVAEHRSRQEMHGLFTRELSTGQRSHIVFKQGDVTLAELYYNPRHDSHEEGIRGINNLQSLTVVQKPDIVLQLTKDEIQRGMNLTYLFDAKYRIEESNGREVPPDDAINQMHRYRDAIYYSQPHDGLRKEVLGGYILFPGKMDKSNPLYKSVEQVNIGAFPLRPGDQEFDMLRDFIRDLMLHNAIDLVEQTIPQKGTTLEVPDKVLVGVVPKENAAQYEDRTSIEYHTGRKVPQTIPLNDIDWFVPYISGNGARDLYRVKRVHTGLKGDSTPDDNLRIILDIEYVQPLYPDYKQFPSGYLVGEVFKHTTIGELYNM